MFTKWGSAAVLTVAAMIFPASAGMSVSEATPAPLSQSSSPFLAHDEEQVPTDGPVSDVALKVLRDGNLSVTETITVPGGQQLVRRVPQRIAVSSDQDRLYSISEQKVEGNGRAELVDDQLVLTLDGGQSVVTYVVAGAVADMGDAQQVRWQLAGGWNTDLARVSASFVAPVSEETSVTCLSGPIGSTQECSLSEVDHTGIVRIEQTGLKAGDRVDLAVQLPAGSVPANARFEQITSLANAFSLTPLVGIGFGALALFLILAALVLWRLRKRDSLALSLSSTVDSMVLKEGDRVYFASPDGVLPGQVGTVIDETVDAVDIAATVIDLAVRNYLWIAEINDGIEATDWQLSRRNPVDEQLLDFEREIFEVLLPEGTDSVLLSELRKRGVLDLRATSEALYDDVVAKGWFARRPDRGRNLLTWVGVGIIALGMVATAVLAFTVGHALLGVAVALAGIGLTLGAAWLPSRTARGRALAAQMRGMLEYLTTAKIADIPDADKETVFSRSLPYAVVLGATDQWLEKFVDLDPSADGLAGLYWFGGLEKDTDLRRFSVHLPAFLAALNGLLAESEHLRSIQPAAQPPAE